MHRRPGLPVSTIVRGALGRLCLRLFGVHLTTRSARWLAAAEAAAPAHHAGDAGLEDPAAVLLERRYQQLLAAAQRSATSRGAARTAARIAPATLALDATAAARARAEAALPAGAVDEPPDRGLRVLLFAASLGEGFLTYAALQRTMAESPLALLLSSLIVAPLIVLAMRASGGIARRAAWREQLAAPDWIVGLGGPLVASVAALGIAWSRVDDVSGDPRAAWTISIGLQLLVLGVAWLWGYRHDGGPLARLAAAQRAHSNALGHLAHLEADASRLARRHAHRLEQLSARRDATLADLAYWRRVYDRPIERASTASPVAGGNGR
jgi:hypothetical protein